MKIMTGTSERIEAVSIGVDDAKRRLAELEKYADLIPQKRPSQRRLKSPPS